MNLDTLIAQTPGERHPGHDTLGDFLQSLPGEGPFERAVHAGWLVNRVGYAFVAGYRAALAALLPTPADALAVTETAGNHPKAIETTATRTATGWQLDGTKMWCTGAETVSLLVVVAQLDTPAPDGRKQLRAFYVPAASVVLKPMPPTPFVPEIGHSHVHLNAVALPASAVLEGDAWTNLVKPFRTVEDIHVLAAITAHASGLALQAKQRPLLEEGIRTLFTLKSLAEGCPNSTATHLALNALDVSDWFKRVCDAAPLARRDDLTRDAPVLGVANRARILRGDRAWQRVLEART